MRALLLLLLTITVQSLFAQTFVESSNNPFEGIFIGAISFTDIDGDNDQDVIMSGKLNFDSTTKETFLYRNDGFGIYKKVENTIFDGVAFGDIAFSDVDMDGDQDVLIVGKLFANHSLATIYLNNGEGVFEDVLDTPFEGVSSCSSVFSDVDADGDPDVIIAGINTQGYGTTTLYLNNGAGGFTEVIDTPFPGIIGCAIAMADVDNDTDQDLLISGSHSPAVDPGPITELYINNGAGNFSLMPDSTFEPGTSGSVAFADVDGDNDQDVLITGTDGLNPAFLFSKLYKNDGQGNFSEDMQTPFPGVSLSSIAFADIDGDNDQDVLITGQGNNSADPKRISKLYTNDGLGTFTEITNTPFQAVDFSAIVFCDVDGDSDQDLFITGLSDEGSISKLYINQTIIASVEVDMNKLEVNIHPNPVTDNKITIDITCPLKGNLVLTLLDGSGRQLTRQITEVLAGKNQYIMDVFSFPKGIYFLKLDTGYQTILQKVVIQ